MIRDHRETATDLTGGTRFSEALPSADLKGVRSETASGPREPGTVVAVVADAMPVKSVVNNLQPGAPSGGVMGCRVAAVPMRCHGLR
ncbi:MAG: hypothetical protein NTW21_12250 [Verrucomicrobia bacterium]|nr:hypothetical protein [Verrucomicrobiota bacterium]